MFAQLKTKAVLAFESKLEKALYSLRFVDFKTCTVVKANTLDDFNFSDLSSTFPFAQVMIPIFKQNIKRVRDE